MIRHATPDDIDRLLVLEDRCFSYDRLTRRSFRHLLRRGHAVTFVAADEQSIQGYALLLFRDSSAIGRLYSLAVDPRYHRRGIARRLMRRLEREVRGRGRHWLTAETRPRNRAMRRLCSELGFREVGRKRRFYEDGVDAILLRKSLISDGSSRKDRP
jgi:ribosomal protein S18 acetylase RimI-like enzyme